MKLSAVLQAGSDRGMVRLRFLATSAGILTSFALLALMVTILKLTGASLGWGIQFQNPWFIDLRLPSPSLLAESFRGSRDAASLGSREPDGDRRRRRGGGQLL